MLRYLRVLGAGAAMALLAGSGAPAGEVAEPDRTPPPSILVVAAEQRIIRDRVLATGSIEPVEEIHVSPLVDGLSIRALHADRGDRVEGGGTLAVLDDDTLLLEKSQLQATLAKAGATLARSQAQLVEARAGSDEAARVADRAERLSTNRTVSTAEVERLRALAAAARARARSAEQAVGIAAADVALARAQIDDVELRLARTTVKAPTGGVISVRNARIGAIASGGGQPLFTIIRDGIIEMKAEVAEADLVKLAVGQVAMVRLAGSGTSVRGQIRLIAPTIDPQTRLGTVRIALADADEARAGMYASATIIAEEKRALVLPRTSVTSENGRTVVRTVADGVVRLTPVVVGIQDGPFVEVLSGLEAGEQAVAKAGAFVRDGDRIMPIRPALPESDRPDVGP